MPSLSSARTHVADIAVVGAGAAGLYAALCAAREHASVVLISATPLAQTASYWAQGGLAATLAEDDSFELHLRDTELAGRALVRRSAAETLVREAPERVRDLQALGVRFDADRFGQLALGLEGGHSVRRVVHAGGSATGRRVVRQLSALAAEEPRIEVFEQARAQAIWTEGIVPGAEEAGETRCRGLVCDDGRVIAARAVVIATGGAAALWARTTNPPGSQGVGVLLAHAAGAEARARRSTTAKATASSTSSPPATRSPRRSTRSSRRRARHPWAWTCGRSTLPTFPTSSRRCAKRASTRHAS
jgi:L-aspartate oxidase